ncbi:caspase family protein [Flammeovirga kamogawensis]|uniref:Caspase family protein n=1 Tax=Flammeovirga kamogawensis TaxID=373891 RepID=A0ABX8H0Q1_9BACT|nr:caspase family protein [Flammeovirga kamogawensis]MBB6462352.1 hypothetical protein [Flammeovirga kamogawensis]QWG09466.1 caspase family protein [Flammeovirga kamogawensis]TRX64982.1 caspase family protein [Flammeovirga kamogawensis]
MKINNKLLLLLVALLGYLATNAQTYDQPELSESVQYALIIGTDKYDGKPMWPNLDNAENDAKSINTVLKKEYDFSTKLLLSPTLEEVEKAILTYHQFIKPKDRFLIYIAGHGDYDQKQFDDGFLVFKDSKTTRKDPTRKSYLQYRRLNGLLNALEANHVALVLDVCFGGSFNEKLRDETPKYRGKVEDEMVTGRFLKKKMNKVTRVYLTSGALERVSDGVDGHSPFCSAILNVLDNDQNTLFTLSDVHQQTKRSMSESMYGSFGKNELGSEYIFSRSNSSTLSNVQTGKEEIAMENNLTRGQKKEDNILLYCIVLVIAIGATINFFVIKKRKEQPQNSEEEVNQIVPEKTESTSTEKAELVEVEELLPDTVEGQLSSITKRPFDQIEIKNKVEVEHQLKLYTIHQKNLRAALEAKAKYGDMAPPILIHRINDAKAELEKIKTELLKYIQ